MRKAHKSPDLLRIRSCSLLRSMKEWGLQEYSRKYTGHKCAFGLFLYVIDASLNHGWNFAAWRTKYPTCRKGKEVLTNQNACECLQGSSLTAHKRKPGEGDLCILHYLEWSLPSTTFSIRQDSPFTLPLPTNHILHSVRHEHSGSLKIRQSPLPLNVLPFFVHNSISAPNNVRSQRCVYLSFPSSISHLDGVHSKAKIWDTLCHFILNTWHKMDNKCLLGRCIFLTNSVIWFNASN